MDDTESQVPRGSSEVDRWEFVQMLLNTFA